jgi:heme/copper-type cytochrome/quinol oxidase subunit 3
MEALVYTSLLVRTLGIIFFAIFFREAIIEGQHTKRVQIGLKMGMILFIVSRSAFFLFCHLFMSLKIVGLGDTSR